MALALEQIRRMRGGAQSHLMRRVAASSSSASTTASSPTPPPPVAVVEVREELVAHTADLVMQLGAGARLAGPGCSSGRATRARRPTPWCTTSFPTNNCAKWKTWAISAACSCSTNGLATRTGARRSLHTPHLISESLPRTEVSAGPTALPQPTPRDTPKEPRRARRKRRVRLHSCFADAA